MTALYGGRGRSSSPRVTTQWVGGGTGTNIVIKDLDFENRSTPSFVACANKAVSLCWRQFGTSRESFSDCMYGFLVNSRLLPSNVAALADQVRIDTSGAFAEGASVLCNFGSTSSEYPAMMSYF